MKKTIYDGEDIGWNAKGVLITDHTEWNRENSLSTSLDRFIVEMDDTNRAFHDVPTTVHCIGDEMYFGWDKDSRYFFKKRSVVMNSYVRHRIGRTFKVELVGKEPRIKEIEKLVLEFIREHQAGIPEKVAQYQEKGKKERKNRGYILGVISICGTRGKDAPY